MTLRGIAAVLTLTGALAVTACTRQNASNPPDQQLPQATGAATPAPGDPSAPVPPGQVQSPQAAPGAQPGYRSDSTPRVVQQAPPVASAPAPDERQTVTGTRSTRTVRSDPEYATKTRSKKKSAAIIGGSAAAGAAVGALAGGGKGAAIGAIAGGVGGLIYDRKTAKKREPVER